MKNNLLNTGLRVETCLLEEIEEVINFLENFLTTSVKEKKNVEEIPEEFEVIYLEKLFKEINFYKNFDTVPVSRIEELQKNESFIKMIKIEQSPYDKFYIETVEKKFLTLKIDKIFIKNDKILKFNF